MKAKPLHAVLLRCYRFGPLFCLKMAAASALSVRGVFALRVPGLREKVLFRNGSSDQEAFDQVFTDLGYEHPFLEGFSPRTVVDAGAYAGYSTVYFASRYPGATVVAVEPEESNYAQLQKNTKGYENVRLVRAALWSREEELSVLKAAAGRHWSSRVAASSAKGAQVVPAVTIPRIMGTHGLDSVDLLKLDIEGAEREVFSGDCGWLGKVKVIVIELHERFSPGCSRAFYSALADVPFKQYVRRENVFVDLRQEP